MLADIESANVSKANQDPETAGQPDEIQINAHEGENELEAMQPKAPLKSQPASGRPESAKRPPAEPLAAPNVSTNVERPPEKKYEPSENSISNIENERDVMNSLAEGSLANKEQME